MTFIFKIRDKRKEFADLQCNDNTYLYHEIYSQN